MRDMDNHASNFTNRPTMEIHVYGLDRCRYNLESGAISPLMTRKYDNR